MLSEEPLRTEFWRMELTSHMPNTTIEDHAMERTISGIPVPNRKGFFLYMYYNSQEYLRLTVYKASSDISAPPLNWELSQEDTI